MALPAEIGRWTSTVGGAVLAAYGLRHLREQRSVAGAMLAAAGGGLIYGGATQFRWRSAAVRFDTSMNQDVTRRVLGGSAGVRAEDAVTVNRSADELYRVWRKFEELPRFMGHLVSVRSIDGSRTEWVARAPGGRTVRWEAEVINDIPGELIGWRTLRGADVVSAGSVSFKERPGSRGTVVKVHLQYAPPAGRAGAAAAWLLGHEPSQTIHEDLRRFKQLMEAGEVPITEGQPRGRR